MKPPYISTAWSKIWSKEYGDTEWLCLKIFFAVWSFMHTMAALFLYSSAPYPTGVLSLFDAGYLMLLPVKIAVAIGFFALLVLYVLEIQIAIATFGISIFSVFIFAIGESNGVMSRNGLMSLIWIAQCLAYSLHAAGRAGNLKQNRFQFPLQAIAAVYTLAAISKLIASPIQWISDAPNLALQIIKSFDFAYYTTGDSSLHIAGMEHAHWIATHPSLTRLLLIASLLLEVCSFVLMAGRRYAMVYGLLLFSMHLGISYFMDIFFPNISIPMITFTANPLYIFYIFTIGWRKKAA